MVTWHSAIYAELHRGLRDALGKPTADQFAKLGIETVGDLMRHTPRRYVAGGGTSNFQELCVGEDAAVVAVVERCDVRQGSYPRVEVTLTDGRERLKVTFFAGKRGKGLRFWENALVPGARGIFVGKVGTFRDSLQLTHPDFAILEGHTAAMMSKEQTAMGRNMQRASMVGLYPATAKLKTWSIADSIHMLLPGVTQLGDSLPEWVVSEAGVLSLPDALRAVHEPDDEERARAGIHRLRFDEAFGMQLAMAHRRRTTAGKAATPRKRVPGAALDAFLGRLPFALTAGQRDVTEQIYADLAQEHPMNRLLQGDVGSGKTVVALLAMLAVVDAGGQAALLAPTEVLAKQHWATVTRLLGDLAGAGRLDSHPHATDVALLVGSLSAADKRAVVDKIASGEAGIVIGTHALLQDAVTFHDLGLVVVDEQHRFGVEQRAMLVEKGATQPHVLIMTATPIPRSLAITVFGDLAVSELTEKPANRAAVQTVFVNTETQPSWVARAWQRVVEEAERGRQAFIVCPAITPTDSESDGPALTAATSLLDELRRGPLANLRLNLVHGKQPAAERDAIMASFVAGEIDVLVCTTVIEVGVDVPNASVMVVMDAHRFGISQLHQLRGRIGRGEHPGLCLLLGSTTDDGLAAERLNALVQSNDGFVLAEKDLELRREGDVLGAAQSGRSSLRLLRVLADRPLIERAKEIADRVMDDPRAATDPLLADVIREAELQAVGDWLERS